MKMTELLTHWGNLKVQEKKLKKAQADIREEIGKNMHKNKSVMEKITDDNEQTWSVSYQISNRRSVDYDLLAETVSDEDYEAIVTTSSGETLTIRQVKEKPKKKDYTKPPKKIDVEIKIDDIKKAPRGKIK